LDTREESEWARGHIPNTIHVGKGIIERDIEKIIPDKGAHRSLMRRWLPPRSRKPAGMGYNKVISWMAVGPAGLKPACRL